MEKMPGILASIKPGDTIYCDVKHVSKSGMTRYIAFYIVKKNQLFRISYLMAKVMSNSYSQDYRALKVSGCGMDMCFETVYNLGKTLWPKGTKKPHGMRNGEPDSDGGYALNYATL